MAPLQLIPVGVGAAYGRPEEAQSCYLISSGDRVICLDLGAGTLNRMRRHVPPERVELLVITHLHPDHCADLFSLRIYMAWGPGRGHRLRVVGPPGLRDLFAAFAGEEGWDDAFTFEELTEEAGHIDLGGGVRLSWREVPHLLPTFAVRLDAEGRSVVFGADCGPNDALPQLAAGADILVTECSSGADEVTAGVPHLNAQAAVEMANRAGVGLLVLTHCYPEHDRDETLLVARSLAQMPVQWAVQDEAVPA